MRKYQTALIIIDALDKIRPKYLNHPRILQSIDWGLSFNHTIKNEWENSL